MTRIDLRFTPDNEDRIRHLGKRATLRHTAHGKQGDEFVVDGRRFVLTRDPVRLALIDAGSIYYTMLGYGSPNEVLSGIKQTYALEHLPPLDSMWYLHVFAPAEEAVVRRL